MRIIMVPVADRPECISALKTAFQLADHLQANIQAFHVRPHRFSEIALPPEAGFTISGSEIDKMTAASEKKSQSTRDAAHEMVRALTETAGFRLQRRISAQTQRAVVWSEQVGYIRNLMNAIGPFADMLIVSSPKRRTSRVAREFMQSAVLHSSRPTLILPSSGSRHIGDNIVIAWDKTHESMLAVVSALPLLKRAQTVSIFTSGAGKPDGLNTRALQSYLQAWGISATATGTKGSETDAVTDIQTHMNEQSADLLVMGSYSRHRLRELIFGGVTDFMLNHGRFPIFTVHSK